MAHERQSLALVAKHRGWLEYIQTLPSSWAGIQTKMVFVIGWKPDKRMVFVIGWNPDKIGFVIGWKPDKRVVFVIGWNLRKHGLCHRLESRQKSLCHRLESTQKWPLS